ncbi:hypothetical protein ACHMW7_05835 [Aminobacter sp. UC22_36]|uniref:hypothetical protein n=1 Tax=Aminobacter sp. UC22_36 TaxID=3374549 RepID=UPI00375743CA
MSKSKGKLRVVKTDEPSTEVAKSYEPTEREQRAMANFRERRDGRCPLPKFKTEMKPSGDGKSSVQVDIDHEDWLTGYELQSEAIKSNSNSYYIGTTDALAQLSRIGDKVHENTFNYAFALIAGIEPKDQLESMLAVQMAAVHMATLKAARTLQTAQYVEQQDSAQRTFTKLARTFATQVEALKRYRSKGEQRVYVERVTVNEGGQAVVGNVASGVGVHEKKSA